GAMQIERGADDVARCFALARELFEGGWETVFQGEVTGLIGAGALVVFPGGGGGADPAAYEGMVPVRLMRGDWWELNEEGTVLFGTRSGGVLRLGDSIAVRVCGVDAIRGRVDLEPAGEG